MERTTQLFTEFNERISKVCEEFADKVSALGGMMKVAENEQEVTKKKLELASNL